MTNIEIIVVDDGSTDGTYSMLTTDAPQIKGFHLNEEVLPARARDFGAKKARGDYVFFIDDDCTVLQDTITHLVKTALYIGTAAGVIGPVITHADKPTRIWCAGGLLRLSSLRELIQFRQGADLSEIKWKQLNIEYSPSAFLLRKKVYSDVDGFDYSNFPIAWEEVDLALRVLNAGYRNFCDSKAIVLHQVNSDRRVWRGARGKRRAYYQGKSRFEFYRKHLKKKLLLMPLYTCGFLLSSLNPNFTFEYIKGALDGLRRCLRGSPPRYRPSQEDDTS